jgi:uncharacterized protein (DUF1684 family)
VVNDNMMMTELSEFRADKDDFFRDDPRSPLLPQQQVTFEGLSYFPANKSLVIRRRPAESRSTGAPASCASTSMVSRQW